MSISPHDRGLLADELSNALAALPIDEFHTVLSMLDRNAQRTLLERLGVTIDPEDLHNGLVHLIVECLPVLDSAEELELAGMVHRALLPDVPDFAAFRTLVGSSTPPVSPSALRVVAIALALEEPSVAGECLTMLDVAAPLQLPWPDQIRDPLVPSWRERIRLLHTVSTHGIELAARQPEDADAKVGTSRFPAVRGIDEALQRADGLFTAVDQILLRSALAVANQVHGAPSPEQLRRAVDEFVRLNADRRSSPFHLGFLAAIDATTPVAGRLQGDRLRWYHFGRLAGLIHRGDEKGIIQECIENRRTVAGIIKHRLMGAIVIGGVTRALIIDHAPLAAELLTAREHPVPGALDLYRDTYWQARTLVIHERSAEAEPLFAALEHLPLRINDEVAERQRHADLVRRRVNCKRSLDDFGAAEVLLNTVGLAGLDDRTVAEHHAERGLVTARIRHLSHLSFPMNETDRLALRERLLGAEPHFTTALEHDPQDLRATYALGVLAACAQDHTQTLSLLERAEVGLIRDPVLSRTQLVKYSRFHRAVAQLALLETGTDAAAVDSAVQSLREGYRPPLATVLETIEALETHGSRHTARFVAETLSAVDDLEPLVPIVVQLLPEHHATLLAATVELVTKTRLSLSARFDLHLAMMRTAARLGDEELLLAAVEGLDELVTAACDVDLDERWAEVLGTDAVLRETLEPAEADLLRAGILQRIGALETAREVIVQLYYRIAQGSLDRYDADDILELLERLGTPVDELEPLRRLVHRAPVGDAPASLPRPVVVLFAGGNETQERYQSQIEETLLERYGDALSIRWFATGWDLNWGKDAERIEAAMPDADAIVIMTYMRTNLGRRLRKSANVHGLTWRSCTGQGRASLERSIINAVEGVLANGASSPTRPGAVLGRERG